MQTLPSAPFGALALSRRRRRALGLLLGLLGSLIGWAADADRPNILVVMMDDLRADALSCTGHPFVQTPAIDRIGREGMIFRNAFATTPLCIPSRASFLTGQYPHTHGFKTAENLGPRSHELVTFPLLLQRAGYESGFFGKWHLGADQPNSRPPPGVDRWVSFTSLGQYVNPAINFDGKTERVTGYLTDILTRETVDFIKRPRSKPFVAYLAHKAVHADFTPAERHRKLFADIPIVRPASAADTREGKPVLTRPGVVLNPKDPDAVTTDENIRDQLRCLMSVEEGMKQILEALAATQQLDRTVIVFTSDHGYFWGEHGLGGKHGAYEEAIRIPLLVRYPKLIRPGATSKALVVSIDLFSTVLELASVTVPKTAQGRSLLPLLRDGTKRVRDSFLAEFFLGGGGATARFPNWQAVRSERWKYIRYPDMDDMNELYDLGSDPLEMKNLIRETHAQKSLEKMKAELARLLAGTN